MAVPAVTAAELAKAGGRAPKLDKLKRGSRKTRCPVVRSCEEVGGSCGKVWGYTDRA